MKGALEGGSGGRSDVGIVLMYEVLKKIVF